MLLLVLHHIAGDGWSLRPLLRDLGALYRARRPEGRAAWLPSLAVQYADYTLWQREVLGDEGDRKRDRAAAGVLEGGAAGAAGGAELPADRPRPAVSSHRGGHVALAHRAELHARACRAGAGSGASLFMVLQAGLRRC